MPAQGSKEETILTLIESLSGRQKDSRLVIGPGDDCAVLKTSPGRQLVVTTDEMVEGTHFITPKGCAGPLASKLLRINLSDLASMGDVKPLSAVCAAGLPRDIGLEWVREFISTLFDECAAFGITLAGGNLARSATTHAGLTVFGEIRPGAAVLRSTAKPGDLLFGVGSAGESRAGLEMLLAKDLAAQKNYPSLLNAFWKPTPELSAGAALGSNRLATAMLDNSDGLLNSVQTLAAQSNCGAVLSVPPSACSSALADYCRGLGRDWKEYVLDGGEDYGLVFTVSPKKADALLKALPRVYPLGVMTEGNKVICDGYEQRNSFEHFQN